MRNSVKCGIIFFVTFWYSYALHIIANVILNVSNKTEFFGTFLSGCSYVIKTLSVAIITHWIRIVRNPNFGRNSEVRLTPVYGRNATKRSGYINYLLIWLVSTIAFASRTYRMIQWVSGNNLQEYFTYSIYNVNLTATGLSNQLAKSLIILDWSCYNLTFLVTAIQFTSFLNNCNNLRRVFARILELINEINRTLIVSGRKNSVVCVARFRVLDREFAGALREYRLVEDRYSLPLFLWITESVSYIILTSRRIKISDFNKISFGALVLDSIFYLTVYLTVLFNSSRVDEIYKEICCKLSEKAIEIPSDHHDLYFQYDLTLKAIYSTRCSLTGFNFYYIDRSFGLTTVGMVFTYLVVIMQI